MDVVRAVKEEKSNSVFSMISIKKSMESVLVELEKISKTLNASKVECIPKVYLEMQDQKISACYKFFKIPIKGETILERLDNIIIHLEKKISKTKETIKFFI